MEELNFSLKREFLAKGYLICDKIGEGGCSKVYKARRINSTSFVAIKILKLSHCYSKIQKLELIAHFKRSVKPYASMQHSAIVTCFESGELYNRVPYAIFEYIQGVSLKQFLIAKTKITPLLAATIMCKVLKALVYTHSIGMIHGDLKPRNIMVFGNEKDPQIKLIDFVFNKGLDEFIDSEPKFLSPQYNAPEQLRGNYPTCESDLYSWALIFLECLIGVPVISGNSIDELIQNHLNGLEHIIPKEIRDHALGDLLALYLNKDVSKRGIDSQYLLEEFSKLDFSKLPNYRINYQQHIQSNIENTILSFPK
ncbi:serine/threonine protein kinase [Ancylomarina sp. DW003]|nr:serine/threonine-protein kinase [Ancylomarina sp. DW003]MDE5423699.1 serine/threonine protein kinase [Ancylomarina sp. DW003]